MKILLAADTEEKALWDEWSEETKGRLSDVSLILSAGDLDAAYLEFLVTMLNVPLVYVRGNHDGSYDENPPEGCIDTDGKVTDLEIEGMRLRIAGLGGSMKYKENAADMYTEDEMRRRAGSLSRKILKSRFSIRRVGNPGDNSGPDILLTHAPARGYGDMDDAAHTGFECFNELLEKYRPRLHCYGHVHREYGNFRRITDHPSGAKLINGSGYYIIDFDAD